jgi:transposase-like protein
MQMSKKTHTNPLSRREIEKLRTNPNIVSVTANTVRFTEAFKKLAYEEKQRGIPVSETMRRCGIDPEMLGPSRVEGFSYTLNKKAKQENGFSDGRSENYRRPPKTGEETVEQRIRQLENELAYTRQEVEFLKKLQAANMEAQRQWESRHRRK